MSVQNVDITELVETMRSSWVQAIGVSVFETWSAAPGFGWLRLPLVSAIAKAVISLILKFASENAVMGAFFLSTAMRKAADATDYLSAVRAKETLSPEATDDDFEKAERAEMDAFHRFVRLTG